jgi:hypothetical protein
MPSATTTDITIFIARRDVTCSECSEALGRYPSLDALLQDLDQALAAWFKTELRE